MLNGRCNQWASTDTGWTPCTSSGPRELGVTAETWVHVFPSLPGAVSLALDAEQRAQRTTQPQA